MTGETTRDLAAEIDQLRSDLAAAVERIERLEAAMKVAHTDIDNSAKWMAAVANSVVHAVQYVVFALNPKPTEATKQARDASWAYIHDVRDKLKEMAEHEGEP